MLNLKGQLASLMFKQEIQLKLCSKSEVGQQNPVRLTLLKQLLKINMEKKDTQSRANTQKNWQLKIYLMVINGHFSKHLKSQQIAKKCSEWITILFSWIYYQRNFRRNYLQQTAVSDQIWGSGKWEFRRCNIWKS